MPSDASAKKVKKEKKEKKEKKDKKAKKERGSKRSREVEVVSGDAAEAAAATTPAASPDAVPAARKRPRTRSMGSVDDDPAVSSMLGSKAAAAAAGDGSGSEDDSKAAEIGGKTSPLSRFPLSDVTVKALHARGIKSLFPIQASTFAPLFGGSDLIGRARTGMGKTLAFVLPTIEQLLQAPGGPVRRAGGAGPAILVMAPTRELAKQVASDFELTAPTLRTLVVYGGTGYEPQRRAMRSGIEIVVGTPGRIKDHAQNGTLNLENLTHVVLDEADQMLDMGFADDMREILDFNPYLNAKAAAASGVKGGAEALAGMSGSKPQVVLFSATLPSWCKDVSRKYMTDPKVINLVVEGSGAASKDVQHLVLQAPWQVRASTTNDLIRMYSGVKGRTIIFCDTKKDANELSVDPAVTVDCGVLHGDISQSQRETTLTAFREGRVRCLVATDVAARGLDIKGVDLVVQLQPPQRNFSGKADVDTYVHRSGRTGRAGAKGTCITLYTHRDEHVLREIERATKNTFVRIGAPQVSDLVGVAAKETVASVVGVDAKVASAFADAAQEALEACDGNALDTIARALAAASGYTDSLPVRSLLSAADGMVTLQYTAAPHMKAEGGMRSASYVWNALRRHLPEQIVESIKGMRLAADGTAAVFDLPSKVMPQIEHALEEPTSGITKCETLPELKAKPSFQGARGGGRGGGRGGRGRGGGRGGRGRGGGYGGRSSSRGRSRW